MRKLGLRLLQNSYIFLKGILLVFCMNLSPFKTPYDVFRYFANVKEVGPGASIDAKAYLGVWKLHRKLRGWQLCKSSFQISKPNLHRLLINEELARSSDYASMAINFLIERLKEPPHMLEYRAALPGGRSYTGYVYLTYSVPPNTDPENGLVSLMFGRRSKRL